MISFDPQAGYGRSPALSTEDRSVLLDILRDMYPEKKCTGSPLCEWCQRRASLRGMVVRHSISAKDAMVQLAILERSVGQRPHQ